MSFDRRSARLDGTEEIRHFTRSARLGSGTLACPRCDVPVALGGQRIVVTHDLDCPFCHHQAPARDFLSLTMPWRPTRVQVRMVRTARARVRT